jgi:heterodisulfide reductase subunit C
MCTVRCPRGVKPTKLDHALESLSSQHGFRVRETRAPVMYQSFVKSIQANGQVHEFSMMVRFYLKTSLLTAMRLLPLALSLLRHGRMSLKPHRAKGREELKQILKKFAEFRGA